jgi:glycosyltransferase involved in cell wall biosynthesis
MKLTIAIPTYDRNSILKHHLALLLPQLTPECRLLIVDNCSPTPVADTIGDLLKSYPTVTAQIERNPLNIGAGANMLRCLENCETEWLWVLSDDDTPKPDAIDTILKSTARWPQCVFFNYSSAFNIRQETFTTTGLDEFVEKMGEFGNIVFMSTGVFRASALRSSVKYGYIYSYSWAPFVATLLHALGGKEQCCFSAEQIVEYRPAVEKRWSYINWGLGMGILLDAPMRPDTRKRLARRIVRSVQYLDFAIVIELSAALNAKRMQRGEARFVYNQICYRIYYFERNPIRLARRAVFGALLWFPRFTYAACIGGLRFIRRRRGKSEDVEGAWVPDRLTGV